MVFNTMLFLFSMVVFGKKNVFYKQIPTQDTLIQVWGILKADSTHDPIESAIIRNKNTNMVTTSKGGIFSIVARAGDELLVSRLGFQPIRIVIPDNYKGSLYEVSKVMKIDRVELPNINVKSYPTADEFKREFLGQSNSLNDPIIEAQKGYDKNSIGEYLKTISTDATQSTNDALRTNSTGIRLFPKKKKKDIPSY